MYEFGCDVVGEHECVKLVVGQRLQTLEKGLGLSLRLTEECLPEVDRAYVRPQASEAVLDKWEGGLARQVATKLDGVVCGAFVYPVGLVVPRDVVVGLRRADGKREVLGR